MTLLEVSSFIKTKHILLKLLECENLHQGLQNLGNSRILELECATVFPSKQEHNVVQMVLSCLLDIGSKQFVLLHVIVFLGFIELVVGFLKVVSRSNREHLFG
jgi:hypothetical protein